MKLFKKALVATAIFGAIGAQAADVSNAVQKTSTQGFEIAGAADASVRVIVREKLEAGDKITLTFGAGLDLEALGAADPIVSADAVLDAGEILIDNGTADYTFTYVAGESDLANGIVVLELDTGYTVEADESFEVFVSSALFDAEANASNATVTYSAASWVDGSAKDTAGDNTGALLVFADQYAASIKKAYNAVIERTAQVTFVKNGDTTGSAAPFNDDTLSDALFIDMTDNGAALLSPVGAAVPSVIVTISGKFTDYQANLLTAGQLEAEVTTAGGAVIAGATVAKNLAGDVVVTLPAAALQDFYVHFTKPFTAGKTLPVTDFTASVDVEFGGADPFAALSGADAGEWMLDATVINIPYFPVGFEGVSTSVHFSNENATDSNLIMTAVDTAGNEYSSSAYGDLAANSVTKLSQTKVMELFGITTPTKLSITFNIDADNDTVNAYAFSNAGTGRQSLVTSQQKGIQ